ncbi:hypothetical protein GCM10020218_048470 [Dactylosporangium vinaceum]
MEPSRVLAALADLAPAGRDRVLDVAKGAPAPLRLSDPERVPAGKAAQRLAALDSLHREERILRRGWAWLTGTAEVDGAARTVRLPLLYEPVRLEGSGSRLRGYRVTPAGDLEVTPLITDRELAAALEAAPGVATPPWLTAIGTTAWIETAAGAAGFKPGEDLLAEAVAALYVARDVASPGLRDTLRAWSARTGLEATALARVYGESAAESAGDDEPVHSPLPLNPAQRDVVRRVRREPVVVVSGPPGNGKSHAVVAAALDTVDRGGSVLVATQAAHAAEVLAGLLRRFPGAEPVLFGDAERRDRFALELTSGRGEGVAGRRLDERRSAVRAAAAAVEQLEASIGAALDLERTAARMAVWEPLLAGLRAEAPLVFRDDFAVRRAERLLHSRFLREWRIRRLAGVGSARLPALLDALAADRGRGDTGRRRGGPTSRRCGPRCSTPTPGCGRRPGRPCTTPRPPPTAGAGPPGAAPPSSAPRCGPGATAAARPSPRSTGPHSSGRCRCGSGPSPTSRTCCRPRPACSTW